MKTLFDNDTTLTDLSIQFEEVTQAQPMKPLEVVVQERVELEWPTRPLPGQIWMGTPRKLRHRKQKRRPRKGMSKILYLLMVALTWSN